MTNRPYYMPDTFPPYCIEKIADFQFAPGFALSQSRKNIRSLHDSIRCAEKDDSLRILEVSSKSEEELGVRLSAFNLSYFADRRYRLESVFQASKLFEGEETPHRDFLYATPADAKRLAAANADKRLVCFVDLDGDEWVLEPKTAYYDWIYINSVYAFLKGNPRYYSELMTYDAFTDIVFNPKRSYNCQAKALAMFVGMCRAGLDESCYKDKKLFIGNYSQGTAEPIRVPKQISFYDLNIE